MKPVYIEILGQGLDTEPPEQSPGRSRILSIGVNHCAKTTRIIQAQRALCCNHLEMIVPAQCGQILGKAQTARHAQMQQQQTLVQIDQKVFSASAHT